MNVGVSRWSAAADFWRSQPLARAVWLGVLGVGLGCESGRVQPPAPEPSAAAPAAASHPASAAAGSAPAGPSPSGAVGRFGAAIEPGATVALASLLSEPKAYADKTVTTEGRVQRACSRKGCWMEIGSGEDSCRITFKDYGFFVPTDSAGAFAKVQGRLDTREVEAAAVEHLESEGAHFRNKRSDGSATEVRMIASAVELRR
jgi:uncharacterized protein DUF4920